MITETENEEIHPSKYIVFYTSPILIGPDAGKFHTEALPNLAATMDDANIMISEMKEVIMQIGVNTEGVIFRVFEADWNEIPIRFVK